MIKYVFLLVALLAGMVLLFLQGLVYRMPSDCMMPHIRQGTWLLVVGNGYSSETMPKNGEVVMYQTYKMQRPSFARIIGCPGDELALNDGLLTLNKHTYMEPYVENDTSSKMPAIQVPEGRYFVLNDRRSVLSDSRDKTIGMLKLEDIKGKVVLAF